jgi:hypothetical protein
LLMTELLIFCWTPIKRFGSVALLACAAAVLTGCGSGAVSGNSSASDSGAATLVLTLTELTSTTARTSIAFGNPAKVNATIRTAGGAPIAGVVVTFTTEASLATFTPSSGTALTDASGVASVSLSAAGFSAAGAGTVTAVAQVASGTTTTALSRSVSYSVGAANVSIGPVAIQTPSLSAFGTTGLSVTVTSGGQPSTVPLEVRFASPCALSGRAALTASATTVSGIASATYRDIGCASADTITATITGTTLSSTGVVTTSAPAVGSIQFVSAQPTSIALRGTGGVGRQETSLVTFRVVDVSGNPVGGRQVDFALNTNVGGLTVTPASAISDATTGIAATSVLAGTISTPVRVTARTGAGAQTLSTQSDQLTISTGVPSQGGFSLSVSRFNIEGGNIDGVTTQINARLADRFSNPVPNGTVVNFTSAGGSIVSSCTTTDGGCSVTLTSQNFRTSNGRIAVLAYAIGEESFTDRNGNGWFDLTPVSELFDLNGISTDLPEAWLDVNENGARETAEPFIDFNNSGAYDGPDGRFNGVSCNEAIAGGSAPGSCSLQKSIHVRGNTAIVFSGSAANITPSPTSVAFAGCTSLAAYTPPQQIVDVIVVDSNGNVMPAGTTVAFATSNGSLLSPTGPTSQISFTVPNSNGCRGPDCPIAARFTGNGDNVTSFRVTLRADAAQSTGATTGLVCTNPVSEGQLTITVTTPSGRITTRTVEVKD